MEVIRFLNAAWCMCYSVKKKAVSIVPCTYGVVVGGCVVVVDDDDSDDDDDNDVVVVYVVVAFVSLERHVECHIGLKNQENKILEGIQRKQETQNSVLKIVLGCTFGEGISFCFSLSRLFFG